jgi:molybdate transport system permease protein
VRSPFSLILAGSTALAVVFLALPLVALFLRVPPGTLLDQLGSDVAREALVVSLKTSAVAHVVVLLVGTPVAYLLGTRVFRGRGLLIGLVELPLVLPPAVAGIALLAAFGNRGLLGGSLEVLGVSLPFTQAAVVVAIIFVSSPFYIRQAAASFAAVDPLLLDASRTLGRGPGRTFLCVALPLAAGGLAAGSSLAFARGLGEFGATIIFAGSFAGVTRTAPLAIYAELDRDFDVAVALGVLLVVFSVAVMAIVALLLSWTRSSSRSPFLFAPSISDSTSA